MSPRSLSGAVAARGGPGIGGVGREAILRYGIGLGVLVLAIVSQYFVPESWPASRGVYGSLAGDLAIVYGIPIVALAFLVGSGPLRRWAANLRPATVLGLSWFGAMAWLGLAITLVLGIVYAIVDPAALKLLSRPNPALEQAIGDPWLYVALSFGVGACEETIFRGWVFGFWVGRTRSWVVPAVLSSVLFAGVHLYYGTTYGAAAPLIFPTLFLLGFGFAATYRASGGNLVVVALLHGAYDATAYLTLVSPLAGNGARYLLLGVAGIVGLVYYVWEPS